MAQTTITITGNLTHEPDLKLFEKSGTSKARLRVAASRRYQAAENEWKEADLLYINVDVWGPLAINCKKSLTRGMPVIVTGVLHTEFWDDKQGNPRQSNLVRATAVGVDLNKYVVGSKKVEHAERNLIGAALPDSENPPTLYDEIIADQSAEVAAENSAMEPAPADTVGDTVADTVGDAAASASEEPADAPF